MHKIESAVARDTVRHRDKGRGSLRVETQNQTPRPGMPPENHLKFLAANRQSRRCENLGRQHPANVPKSQIHQAAAFTNCTMRGTISLRNLEPLKTP